MRNKRKSLIFAITLLVLCFGIGYAYLTTTLSINGTTDIDSNNWDIYFDNVQVTDGSVTGDQVTQAPTIDNTTKTTVSFHIRLKEPGEFYEFTIDAKNDGTIDAMIETVEKKLNGVVVTTLPPYLYYEVTYYDDVEIEENHLLEAETIETYKVRVEYRTDINPSDLPSNAQEVSLSFGVSYIQANANAVSVENRYYYSSADWLGIGDTLPVNGIYTSYREAMTMNPYGDRSAIMFRAENSVITETYVVFILNGKKGVLRAGGATYNNSTGYYNDDSIYYEDNKKVLTEIYGEENCEETIYGEYHEYCCVDEERYMNGITWSNGGVSVMDGGFCSSSSNGKGNCDHGG